MCDHKKKELNVPKQTPHEATDTHAHTHTHTKRKKNTLFQPGGAGVWKRPQDFRARKTKVAIDRCRMLTLSSVWGQLGHPLLLLWPLSLSILPTSLAICYLCNVYVWMVNICKYPTPYPVYLYAHLSHLHFPLRFGSIYAAVTPDPPLPLPVYHSSKTYR